MADAEDEAKVGAAGEEGETRRFWVGLFFSELVGFHYLACLHTTSRTLNDVQHSPPWGAVWHKYDDERVMKLS